LGAAAPSLAHFFDGSEEPERTVLVEELLALDRACRERYGAAALAEGPATAGAADEASADAATRPAVLVALAERAKLNAGFERILGALSHRAGRWTEAVRYFQVAKVKGNRDRAWD
jgi:hypothetical protein